MPNETITGKIYPVWNADKTERRFPQTVIEAVLGLPTYLQDQFSALADIYMPIEGITESKTGQEFVYRKSPATIKAKSLTLDRIYGKTLAWNQLANCSSSISGSRNNVTWSYANNTLTIVVGTGGASADFGISLSSIPWIVGHKYLFSSGMDFTPSSNTIRIGNNYYRWFDSAKAIWTCPGSNGVFSVRIASGCAAGTYHIYGPMVLDLTLLYGSEIDGLTDEQILAKFESEFPGYHDFGNKLISNDAAAIETVGFNQWNEEVITGYYSGADGVYVNNANRLCSKNFTQIIPGQTYYLKAPIDIYIQEYDANKNYIGVALHSSNTTIPFSQNARYFHVGIVPSYGTTYNHDICINLSDPAKNGTYEPYRKTTLQLGLNNFKVKSHNIWDEEWEQGDINSSGQDQSSTLYIRSKNYIPVIGGQAYYFLGAYQLFTYDANKTFIEKINSVSETTKTLGSNVAYVRFNKAGSSYNHDICINLSSSFNGQYEPHGILTIDGLQGAGTAFDEIVGNKYIKRVGEVDLGTMTWRYEYGRLITSSLVGIIKEPANGDVPNAITPKHIPVLYTSIDASNKAFTVIFPTSGAHGQLWFKDSAYSDAATFKTAMSGVMLNYELATPIEYELVEPLVYSMAAGTTEARISPNSDGLSAPFCCDMTYDANANNDSANAQYAATAGRLYNSHKLWGRDFDGTNDVSGALSGVTTIDASGNITTVAQLISTVATGTAPLSVASTTEVANLHSYTATKLHTQRTLWGQNFDGSGNVTGDMSSVGNIAFSTSGKNIASLLYFDTTNSRVGVGASSPAYKLDVNGTLNASGNTTLGGTLDVKGNTTIGGTFTVGTSSVNKATTLYGALTASGAVSFTSTLGVTGLSTLAGGIKLTTTKKIWFGDTYYIELDANNHLHTNAGFYSTSFITAGGVGSGSGGGSNLVKERAYDISLTQIASSDYAELIRSPYISDSDSGFMFAYSPAFLDTASQMHDYVIDAIGHEIGSCDIQWIGIAIGSTYTDVGVFDSGAFLVLAKSGNTYYWYEFEV